MKFILLFRISAALAVLSTLQNSSPRSSPYNVSKSGKNIPAVNDTREDKILLNAPVNDIHVVTSSVIPNWETICK